MKFLKNTYWLKRIVFVIAVAIVPIILWNTYKLFQKFKQEERIKMEVLAEAQKEISRNAENLNASVILPLKILETNSNIPLILVNWKGEIISSQNLDPDRENDQDYLKRQLAIMKEENQPIRLYYLGKVEYIYYKNSKILTELTYYSFGLLVILTLFLTITYLVFSSNKVAEQNKLWTGMAKETAHQIGTPLSSLLGWIEILKLENVDPDYIVEMQKDIDRLNTIANRFSKIGSIPDLQPHNVVELTKNGLGYLESRASKQIQFSFQTSDENLQANINEELFGWVIENLVKNAIDAMGGKGALSVLVNSTAKYIKIQVSDTGKGILKSQFKEIFKPGFTTKKRGWGLGLSLSKRIINDYHKGRISVHKSEINKGTIFQISIEKL